MSYAVLVILVVLMFITVDQVFAQVDVKFSDVTDPVVVIETNLGKMVIGFFPADAPKHVENFIGLSYSGYYKETVFHRIISGFMIQGGDPNSKDGDPNSWGLGGPSKFLDAEFNSIKHNRGIVSMARSQDPNSAGSQFFIVHKDSNFLDEQYTVFGRLITDESFQTLDKIASVETDERDRPLNPEQVRITKISVVPISEISDLMELLPPERIMIDSPILSGNQIFNSEELEIQISFPEGWLLQEPGDTQDGAPNIVAVGPKNGIMNPNISLTIIDGVEKTFDSYIQEKKSNLDEILKNNKLKIISEGKIKLNNYEAYQIIAEASFFSEDNSFDVKFSEITILENNLFYIITYANDINDFNKQIDRFNDSLNSIEFSKNSIISENDNEVGGGCLIATATFDSELAPQVQKLREIRDSKLLQTESGSQFISSFNQFYYSFSPYVADYERENPIFKEIVKIGITPMITTLSIMDYAENELEVLGFGISVILMNMGMYFVAPAIIIFRIKKLF
jgi:peptidyl-prolyl cis-trans isomerase B (cyclophilin B)